MQSVRCDWQVVLVQIARIIFLKFFIQSARDSLYYFINMSYGLTDKKLRKYKVHRIGISFREKARH